MVVLSLVISAVLVVALAGLAAWFHRAACALEGDRPTRGWLEQLEVEPVLVELVDHRTVAGILTHVDETSLTLRQARLLGPAASVHVGGEFVIPRERVEWIQRGIRLDDVGDLRREAA